MKLLISNGQEMYLQDYVDIRKFDWILSLYKDILYFESRIIKKQHVYSQRLM